MHPVSDSLYPPAAHGAVVSGSDAGITSAALGSLLSKEDAHRLDLAQRLHKDVSGGLAVCTTLCEMVRMTIEMGGDAASLTDSLNKLEQNMRQTAQTVRLVTEEQYPLALKAFGLVFALQRFASEVGSAGDAGPTLSVTSEGKEIFLPLDQRYSVYQILSGLVQHATQASGATVVSLHVEFHEATVEFLIVHDGESDHASDASAEANLACIRARMSPLGARLLSSCTSPEGAVSLRLVVPLPAPAATAPPVVNPVTPPRTHEHKPQLQHTRG